MSDVLRRAGAVRRLWPHHVAVLLLHRRRYVCCFDRGETQAGEVRRWIVGRTVVGGRADRGGHSRRRGAGGPGNVSSPPRQSNTAGGVTATAPVTIVVARTTPADEAADARAGVHDRRRDGAASGAQRATSDTGSVRIGNASPTPARITLDRPTDKGRLLTIVTDKPILFVGGGLPDAKPQRRLRLRGPRHRGRCQGERLRHALARRQGESGAGGVRRRRVRVAGDASDRRHAGAMTGGCGAACRPATPACRGASAMSWGRRPRGICRGDRAIRRNVFSNTR